MFQITGQFQSTPRFAQIPIFRYFKRTKSDNNKNNQIQYDKKQTFQRCQSQQIMCPSVNYKIQSRNMQTSNNWFRSNNNDQALRTRLVFQHIHEVQQNQRKNNPLNLNINFKIIDYGPIKVSCYNQKPKQRVKSTYKKMVKPIDYKVLSKKVTVTINQNNNDLQQSIKANQRFYNRVNEYQKIQQQSTQGDSDQIYRPQKQKQKISHEWSMFSQDVRNQEKPIKRYANMNNDNEITTIKYVTYNKIKDQILDDQTINYFNQVDNILDDTSTLNSNQNKMLVKIQQKINNFKNINKQILGLRCACFISFVLIIILLVIN